MPDPFSPTRNVTPAGRSRPRSSTAATAGIAAHQTRGATSAAGSSSTRRTGRVPGPGRRSPAERARGIAVLLVLPVGTGEPGRGPRDGVFGLRGEVDEGAPLGRD